MSTPGPLDLVFGPYEYTDAYLPGVPYSAGLHLQDLPLRREGRFTVDWFVKVTARFILIQLNNLVADGESDLLGPELIERALTEGLEATPKLAERLPGPAHDLLTEAHALAQLFADGADLDEAQSRAAHAAVLAWMDKLSVKLTAPDRADPRRSKQADRTLADYEALFPLLGVPAVARDLEADEVFANLRVGGYNPLVLTRYRNIPNFELTDSLLRKAPRFAQDSVAEAIADGRLYLTDYAALDVLTSGSLPSPKNVYRPIALFGVPNGGRHLLPIAIQVAQRPSGDNVFSPGEAGWDDAKNCVNAADANYHEMFSHLGRTHLFVEPFVVSTHRKLKGHRLAQLLLPHFEGTIFINAAAVKLLVNEGGPVDRLLMGTIGTDLQLAANAIQDLGFDDAQLPTWLAARGLDDTKALPVYPYRDDGLEVWGAIRAWVSDYVGAFYDSDAAVAGDQALQAWAADLLKNGRVPGFGQGGGVKTVTYLVDALTMIIFTASAGHAAVNFPQASIMSYTPAAPLAGYGPPPPPAYPWVDMLPDVPMAQEQLTTLALLGGVYFTRLGAYGRSTFRDRRVKRALDAFKARLLAIELRIKARNLFRKYPYTHLLPSRIPQSINI